MPSPVTASKSSVLHDAAANKDGNSQMLMEERRQYILRLAQDNGRVLVEELSQMLGISSITIRKDLDQLQNRGVLQRTHGGAMLPNPGSLADPTLQEKERRFSVEKKRISEAAVKLVHEGQCILLDSGTTTTAVAKALKSLSSLTVITNAVNIASELNGTDFEVLLTGGSLRKNSFSLVGPLAEDMLQDMHADILVNSSSKVVAVCDSTKFGRRSLCKIVDASAIHHVITDRNISGSAAERIRNVGIELTLV
jgi:DeoR family transcriptional regulator of aga operon